MQTKTLRLHIYTPCGVNYLRDKDHITTNSHKITDLRRKPSNTKKTNSRFCISVLWPKGFVFLLKFRKTAKNGYLGQLVRCDQVLVNMIVEPTAAVWPGGQAQGHSSRCRVAGPLHNDSTGSCNLYFIATAYGKYKLQVS